VTVVAYLALAMSIARDKRLAAAWTAKEDGWPACSGPTSSTAGRTRARWSSTPAAARTPPSAAPAPGGP